MSSRYDDDDSDYSDDYSVASSQITSVSRNGLNRGGQGGYGESRASNAHTEKSKGGKSVRAGSDVWGSPDRSTAPPTTKPKLPHSSRNNGNPLESFCSEFGREFENKNLPICIDQGVKGASKRHVGWHVDVLSLDFSHHLPLFITGLVETDPPYNFLSYEGAIDMILVGGPRNRLLGAVQNCMPALKLGLQVSQAPAKRANSRLDAPNDPRDSHARRLKHRRPLCSYTCVWPLTQRSPLPCAAERAPPKRGQGSVHLLAAAECGRRVGGRARGDGAGDRAVPPPSPAHPEPVRRRLAPYGTRGLSPDGGEQLEHADQHDSRGVREQLRE